MTEGSLACSELSAVGDKALLGSGTSGGRADSLKLAHNVVIVGADLSEDDVLAVKVRRGGEAEEELRAVGVGAGVRHGEDTSASVSVCEVLIAKLSAIDGLTTSAITSGEVATLGHEAWDDAVELAALEVQVLSLSAHASLSSAKAAEVLSSLWCVLRVECHNDSASRLATNGHIKVDLSHFCSSVFLFICNLSNKSIINQINFFTPY